MAQPKAVDTEPEIYHENNNYNYGIKNKINKSKKSKRRKSTPALYLYYEYFLNWL